MILRKLKIVNQVELLSLRITKPHNSSALNLHKPRQIISSQQKLRVKVTCYGFTLQYFITFPSVTSSNMQLTAYYITNHDVLVNKKTSENSYLSPQPNPQNCINRSFQLGKTTSVHQKVLNLLPNVSIQRIMKYLRRAVPQKSSWRWRGCLPPTYIKKNFCKQLMSPFGDCKHHKLQRNHITNLGAKE